MKNAKTYILIGVLVLVLAGAAYLNFAAANNSESPSKSPAPSTQANGFEEAEKLLSGDLELPVIASGDSFADYKKNREEVRNKEIGYLDTIIEDEKTDAETLADAQAQKLETVRSMEKELTIEGLLGAKGFENSIVTVHTGSVNVVVQAKELSEAQAAQILDIVQKETGESAQNIKVILQE